MREDEVDVSHPDLDEVLEKDRQQVTLLALKLLQAGMKHLHTGIHAPNMD